MKKKKNQAHFLILNSHSEFLQKVYKFQESQDQGQGQGSYKCFPWVNQFNSGIEEWTLSPNHVPNVILPK